MISHFDEAACAPDLSSSFCLIRAPDVKIRLSSFLYYGCSSVPKDYWQA